MESISALFFDVILIALLGVTINYCLRLSKQLQTIRDGKSEMALLIRQFAESTEQARISVEELKTSAKKVTENLQSKVEKAGFLADDLSFLIEKANRMADGMERGISGSRGGKQSSEPSISPKNERVVAKMPVPPSRAEEREVSRSRSKAEKELLEALKAMK